MDIGKVLISSLVFVFTMFLFTPLESGIAAMNQTAIGDLVPVLQAFPLLLVAISAVFPIFFLMKGDKS
jgi:hypothetical protein